MLPFCCHGAGTGRRAQQLASAFRARLPDGVSARDVMRRQGEDVSRLRQVSKVLGDYLVLVSAALVHERWCHSVARAARRMIRTTAAGSDTIGR